MIELGGANSCFANAILNRIGPREYHAIDMNAYGLESLSKRFPGHSTVTSTRMNVLDIKPGDVPPADVVFSIGLIEHFDTAGTRRAIEAHFDLLQPGGCAIISFPTPTLLYRAARAICETLGLWKFPDERPLEREEVIETAGRHGEVFFEKTLWPLVFTQRIMVFRKSASR